MFGALADASSFCLGKGNHIGVRLTWSLVTAQSFYVRCEPPRAWASVLTIRSGSFTFALPSQPGTGAERSGANLALPKR
jgi:hypothetical protein